MTTSPSSVVMSLNTLHFPYTATNYISRLPAILFEYFHRPAGSKSKAFLSKNKICSNIVRGLSSDYCDGGTFLPYKDKTSSCALPPEHTCTVFPAVTHTAPERLQPVGEKDD